jgi:hypothetical protein
MTILNDQPVRVLVETMLAGLISSLPQKTPSEWPIEARVRWLRAATAI